MKLRCPLRSSWVCLSLGSKAKQRTVKASGKALRVQQEWRGGAVKRAQMRVHSQAHDTQPFPAAAIATTAYCYQQYTIYTRTRRRVRQPGSARTHLQRCSNCW